MIVDFISRVSIVTHAFLLYFSFIIHVPKYYVKNRIIGIIQIPDIYDNKRRNSLLVEPKL
jgi:hypothetical protein